MVQAVPLPGGVTGPEILPAGMPEAAREVVPDALGRALDLPLTLTLEIPAVEFTVGGLMRLGVGSIVETATQQIEDLPLTVNGQLVGLVEIEVVGSNLAVRLAGVA